MYILGTQEFAAAVCLRLCTGPGTAEVAQTDRHTDRQTDRRLVQRNITDGILFLTTLTHKD